MDFVFDGNEIRGLEQNPETKSRWARMARAGKRVMQFLNEGRHLASVVDGNVTLYGRRAEKADSCWGVTHRQLFKNEQSPVTQAANSGILCALVRHWRTSPTACTPKRRIKVS